MSSCSRRLQTEFNVFHSELLMLVGSCLGRKSQRCLLWLLMRNCKFYGGYLDALRTNIIHHKIVSLLRLGNLFSQTNRSLSSLWPIGHWEKPERIMHWSFYAELWLIYIHLVDFGAKKSFFWLKNGDTSRKFQYLRGCLQIIQMNNRWSWNWISSEPILGTEWPKIRRPWSRLPDY